MQSVQITLQGFDTGEVLTELKRLTAGQEILIHEHSKSETFVFDPATASIVVAGVSVLSALITAAFAYLAKKGEGKIVIKGASGRSIEAPANASPERIEELIAQARMLDAAQVYFIRD